MYVALAFSPGEHLGSCSSGNQITFLEFMVKHRHCRSQKLYCSLTGVVPGTGEPPPAQCSGGQSQSLSAF